MPRTSDVAVSDVGRASFEASVGTSVASQIIENDSASQNGAAAAPAGVGPQTLGGLVDRLMQTGNETAGASGCQPAATATHSATSVGALTTSRVSGSEESGDAAKSGVKAVSLTGLAEMLVQPETKHRVPPVKDFATAARFSKEHRLQRDCVAVMGAFRPVGGSRGAFVVANTHIYWCVFHTGLVSVLRFCGSMLGSSGHSSRQCARVLMSIWSLQQMVVTCPTGTSRTRKLFLKRSLLFSVVGQDLRDIYRLSLLQA